MGFKTAEDGHVYNDDKKNSSTHHGSVRPETGIKMEGKKSGFYGKKIGEYELNDILQDVTFENAEKVAKENILYTLKREKKWSDKYNLILPAGTLKEFRDDTKDEGGFYQFDFAVFDSPNDVKYSGTAYGSISNGTMLDMTVELYENESRKKQERLVDSIRNGSIVTIVDSRGQKVTGRATMKSSLGGGSWVINTGGRFGKPAIASDENVVSVR